MKRYRRYVQPGDNLRRGGLVHRLTNKVVPSYGPNEYVAACGLAWRSFHAFKKDWANVNCLGCLAA